GASTSAMRISDHPRDVQGLAHEERDALIISTRTIEGRCIVLSRYADCRWHLVGQPTNRPPADQTLNFDVVSAVWRETMKAILHPWPGTSATHLAGLTGRGSGYRGGQTPLMPDEVFTRLFQRAWSLIEDAEALLDLRDELIVVRQLMGRDLRGVASPAEREVV